MYRNGRMTALLMKVNFKIKKKITMSVGFILRNKFKWLDSLKARHIVLNAYVV